MSAYGLHAPHLAPSGCAFAVALRLTPHDASPHRGRLAAHLVTARDDCVTVWEVRLLEEATRLYCVRSHRLFGNATGLARMQLEAKEGQDERERVLVSFKDAKMSLLEWSDAAGDLQTVSIHTYERAPQLSSGLPPNFRAVLAGDPASRCAALLLPGDAIAVLPFFQDEAELEMMDELSGASGLHAGDMGRSLPYAPSFVLPLRDVDASIRNVRDVVFLPDFQRPTLAVLFSSEQTWTGRLNEHRDVCSVYLMTLDLTISSTHPLISTRSSLPYNCLYLTACPAYIGGGVLVATPTALFHVDQGGKVVGLALSEWHAMTSDLSLPLRPAEGRDVTRGPLNLNGSHIVFPPAQDRATSALLFARDGEVYAVVFELDGRSLSKLSLELRSTTVPPAQALTLPDSSLVFVGSMVGHSELLRMESRLKVKGEGDADIKPDAAAQAMELDIDDDLYGDSGAGASANGHSLAAAETEMHLLACARMPGLGPVLDVTAAVMPGEDAVEARAAQTAACTGAAPTGGLTLFEPKLLPRKRHRLALDAASGIWVLPQQRPDAHSLALASSDTSTTLFSLSADGDVSIVATLAERTINATALAPRGAETAAFFARAVPQGLEVLTANGDVLQAVSVSGKGKAPSSDAGEDAEVYQAHLNETHAAIVRNDGQLQLHAYDEASERFSRVALPQELHRARYSSASLFEDRHGYFRWAKASTSAAPTARRADAATASKASRMDELGEEIDYGDDDMPAVATEPALDQQDPLRNGTNGHAAAPRAHAGSWLVLVTADGVVEIRALTDLALAWCSNSLSALPQRLDYTPQTGSASAESGLYVVQACMCVIGDAPHLAASFENGLVTVYEAVPFAPQGDEASAAPETETAPRLSLSFVKVLGRQLSTTDVAGPASEDEVATLAATLTPFVGLGELSGVFLGGEQSGWVFKDPAGPLRFRESAEGGIDVCIPLRCPRTPLRFLFSQYGTICTAELPDLSFDLDVPYRHLPSPRTYTHLAAHPVTRTLVAASESPQRFNLFDPEEGTVVQDPALDPSPAYTARGALELFVDSTGAPVDGYEFDQCEFACCVELVTLASVSTLERTRDYIAVGTMTAHGEDRPSNGVIYIFDVVEVVANPEDPAARYRLRLVFKEKLKAPITTITDINGFLVVTMGQKLFVRSLENDEWLITIAFLDIPYQTTMIRRINNFLLLSDVRKSTWFVAFQESPYRLVVLGKDFVDTSAATGDYLVDGANLGIVSTSTERVMRLFDYAPNVPASQGGLKLMLRAEYQLAAEPSCTLMIPGAAPEGGFSQQSEIVYGMRNGSIDTLVPVEQGAFQRLQLLQTQLVRNVQHVAGLNPRAYRAVRNDHVSRPLMKGILDGMLLSTFESLPRPKMIELVDALQGAMGESGADQALRDIASLRSHWGQAIG